MYGIYDIIARIERLDGRGQGCNLVQAKKDRQREINDHDGSNVAWRCLLAADIFIPSLGDTIESMLCKELWNQLSFVDEGNVHGIGVLYTDGSGPIGLAYFADNIVQTLTGD